MYFQNIDLPVGKCSISASNLGITVIGFNSKPVLKEHPNALTQNCALQLKEYFDKKRQTFNVPLDMSAGTPFFQKVWELVFDIPYGKTVSYKDIALQLGDKNATRAVGMANGKNPIPIIVPCHRVIGSNGSLTGYAYGLDMKKELLMLESPETMGIQKALF